MNKNIWIRLAWAFVLVFETVKTVQGLKCYECDDCVDPFNKNKATEVTCDTSCGKAKETTGSNQAVARGCLDKKIDNGCATGEFKKVKGSICACNKDLCNAGNQPQVSIIPVVAGAAAVLTKLLLKQL
ncbi:protein quiver-like [Dreissena polymorpha]|uniref:Protein quiver n=1 Tax=Dreissena polymorpha TaxID=45954 RepID=A0A9D4HTA5_DREPO|nr:protein quiver-like [Dreissena polymorpha]KAH3728713.1 hypothetical protein DPMN_054673 [Dreissena polymorpha]